MNPGAPSEVDEVDDGPGVLVRIRGLLPALRPSEQRIAQYFLKDPAQAARSSITEVARSCDTSTTSVVRFTRRVGYDHYNDLRIDITRDLARETYEGGGAVGATGDIDRTDTMDDIVAKISFSESRSIADTVMVLDRAELRKAVDAIANAKRVDIFGVGASSIVGLDLQHKLVRIGRTSLAWSDGHAAITAAATLDSSCVALGVSHSGDTTEAVEYLAAAQRRGATTIAITNHAGSRVAEHADIVLLTAARETKFRSGAMGSRIAQSLVIDCLFIGVAQASYEPSMEALRDTYSAVRRLRVTRDD